MTEYPQAHFQGKIYFKEGWVALEDGGEPDRSLSNRDSRALSTKNRTNQPRADAVTVIEVADMKVPEEEREKGDPLGWHEFAEGKIRFTGSVRGVDEAGHEGFAVWLPDLPTLYGEIDSVFVENGNDFNLEVLSFGWPWLEMLGAQRPNSIYHGISNKQALKVQSLFVQNVALVKTYYDRPFILNEYDNSKFLGKVFFRDDWVNIEEQAHE